MILFEDDKTPIMIPTDVVIATPISISIDVIVIERLRKNMILLLSHVIQLPTTLRAISLLGYDLYIDVTDLESWGAYYSFDDVMLSKNNNKCKMKVIVTTSNKISKRLGQGLILVMPDVTINETHSAMIEQIITNFDYTCGSQSLLSKQIIDQEVGYRK